MRKKRKRVCNGQKLSEMAFGKRKNIASGWRHGKPGGEGVTRQK